MPINEVILCYTCDSHHSHTSKEIIRVFTTLGRAIKALKRTYSKSMLNTDDLKNLEATKQTQGKGLNFILEEVKINKKL